MNKKYKIMKERKNCNNRALRFFIITFICFFFIRYFHLSQKKLYRKSQMIKVEINLILHYSNVK